MTPTHNFVYADYTILAIAGIVAIIFLFTKWNWISRALSEGDSPSAKRLCAFLFTLTTCTCEIINTIKKQEFVDGHMYAFLAFILLLLGVATVAQVISLWKGNSPNTTTVTKTDVSSLEIKQPV
jgi:amino acid transporter